MSSKDRSVRGTIRRWRKALRSVLRPLSKGTDKQGRQAQHAIDRQTLPKGRHLLINLNPAAQSVLELKRAMRTMTIAALGKPSEWHALGTRAQACSGPDGTTPFLYYQTDLNQLPSILDDQALLTHLEERKKGFLLCIDVTGCFACDQGKLAAIAQLEERLSASAVIGFVDLPGETKTYIDYLCHIEAGGSSRREDWPGDGGPRLEGDSLCQALPGKAPLITLVDTDEALEQSRRALFAPFCRPKLTSRIKPTKILQPDALEFLRIANTARGRLQECHQGRAEAVIASLLDERAYGRVFAQAEEAGTRAVDSTGAAEADAALDEHAVIYFVSRLMLDTSRAIEGLEKAAPPKRKADPDQA